MTNIIATPNPSRPGARKLPVAVTIAAELIVWAELLAFIVFAVRSCT